MRDTDYDDLLSPDERAEIAARDRTGLSTPQITLSVPIAFYPSLVDIPPAERRRLIGIIASELDQIVKRQETERA